jgi:hypothetical protein
MIQTPLYKRIRKKLLETTLLKPSSKKKSILYYQLANISDDFWSDTGFNLIGEKNVIFDNDDFKNIDVFSEISLQHGDM